MGFEYWNNTDLLRDHGAMLHQRDAFAVFYDATRYTRAETNIVLTRNMPNWAHIVQSRSPPLEISTLIFEIGEIGL